MANEIFLGIDKALKKGLELKVFRSGGGLRVVGIFDPSLPDEESQKAYGEMPNLRPALMLASKDYQAGGTPYECHYLTGSQTPEENLDYWILIGNKLFAKVNSEGGIEIHANKYDETTIVKADGPTFAEAYKTLNTLVTDELIEKSMN